MEQFNIFIDYIARTNLFNFIIFSFIIIVLVKKINVPAKLELEQNVVKDTIMDSEKAKLESEERLNSIEELMAHIEDEIDSILEKSTENANFVGEKILRDSNKTAQVIQENANKALENSYTILTKILYISNLFMNVKIR